MLRSWGVRATAFRSAGATRQPPRSSGRPAGAADSTRTSSPYQPRARWPSNDGPLASKNGSGGTAQPPGVGGRFDHSEDGCDVRKRDQWAGPRRLGRSDQRLVMLDKGRAGGTYHGMLRWRDVRKQTIWSAGATCERAERSSGRPARAAGPRRDQCGRIRAHPGDPGGGTGEDARCQPPPTDARRIESRGWDRWARERPGVGRRSVRPTPGPRATAVETASALLAVP